MRITNGNWINVLILYGLVFFYSIAGINHFLMPEFYWPLIPNYLPNPDFLNILSGMIEIMLAVGIFFKASRKVSAYLIILMLFCFLPAHIHFINVGGCVSQSLCVPAWISWIRLIIIHPLLIYWAYACRNLTL